MNDWNLNSKDFKMYIYLYVVIKTAKFCILRENLILSHNPVFGPTVIRLPCLLWCLTVLKTDGCDGGKLLDCAWIIFSSESSIRCQVSIRPSVVWFPVINISISMQAHIFWKHGLNYVSTCAYNQESNINNKHTLTRTRVHITPNPI